jgi:hypothetical protein
MRRIQDTLTRDLFAVPEPAPELPGTHDFRVQVAHLVGEITKAAEGDRYAVAARMSRLTGKEVSKNMLDAYASEGREDHNLPLYLAPALEVSCASYLLTNWLADVRGGQLLIGREALMAELGRLERSRDVASQNIKRLKVQLGESHA